jgi:hypothetical protein
MDKKLKAILEALAKAMKIPFAELETMAKEENEENFESKVTATLEKQFEDGKTHGIKDGKKGLKGEFGTFLKDKLGYTKNVDKFDDDFKGSLLDHAKELLKDELKAELAELEKNKGGNADEIKVLKKQIDTLKTEKATLEKTSLENEGKVKSEYDKKLRFATAESTLKSMLRELNANIPENNELASRKFEILKNQLEKVADLDFDDNDKKFYLLGSDGQRVRGKGSLPVVFDEWGKEQIELLYGFNKTQKKDGGATPPDKADGSDAEGFKSFKGTAPKTADEYQKIVSDHASYNATQRLEVMEYWEKQNPPPAQ